MVARYPVTEGANRAVTRAHVPPAGRRAGLAPGGVLVGTYGGRNLRELADALDEMSQRVLAGDAGSGLQSITEGVVELIPHIDGAGISLLDRGRIETAAQTSDLQAHIDRIQMEAGEGPCLAAIAEPDTALFEISDMSRETRWPRFAEQVSALGVQSKLAFVLRTGEHVAGALNVYASRPDVFTDEDRQIGAIFADHASLAMDHARVKGEGEREADQLQEALANRDVIGQAKGILMERSGLDADEAFAVLRLLSQRRNVKLREVAGDVVKSVLVRGARTEPS